MFGPFLWTAYADATRKGERIFLLNTWICALVALLIPIFERFAVVAAVILAFALFGIFYLAAVQTVDCLVPDGLRASAQGLFTSVTFGVGGLAGNSLAGFLYEPLGMTWLYAAAALVSAGSTVLYWVGTGRSIKREQMATAPLPGGKLR